MSLRILYREIETLSFERLIMEEIERRYREYKEGKAECLSGEEEEVIAELLADQKRGSMRTFRKSL
jgi:hypothetical protein